MDFPTFQCASHMYSVFLLTLTIPNNLNMKLSYQWDSSPDTKILVTFGQISFQGTKKINSLPLSGIFPDVKRN